MTSAKGRIFISAPLILALQGLLTLSSVGGQDVKQSPSDLIRFLTHQSARTDMHGPGRGVFSCGEANIEFREDRHAADALAREGVSAVPDIESAFNLIEAQGQRSAFAPNSGWLLNAYARIRGRAAYPRLRRMHDNPELAFMQPGIDNALAVSLGITSYVSDSRALADIAVCRGVLEPKDLLDLLIAAWESDDRHWVEAALGPAGKAALASLLEGTTWEGVRSRSWRARRAPGTAVGYEFTTPGWWSVREEPLEINLTQRTPANPEVVARFTDRAGRGCGSYRVSFIQTREFYVRYLVDNSNLGGLLDLIAACASEPGRPN